MKLGVLDLVPILCGNTAEAALQQALLLARTAERCGYSRYWTAEHHDMAGLACTAPEVLLAYIGAQTAHIRLGTGALLLPHYKPIKVAETIHLLSALLPGRMDLGIGRAPGGSAAVSIALSNNFLANVREFPESLRILTELLQQRYQVEGSTVQARPVPSYPPELWLLGTSSKSANHAAQFGTGYVFGQFMSDQDGLEIVASYRRQFQPSAFTEQPKVIIAINVICAETEEQAYILSKEGMPWIHQSEQLSAKKMPINCKKLIIGTAEQVKEQLEQMLQAYETDECLIVTFTPQYADRLSSYERVAEAILKDNV